MNQATLYPRVLAAAAAPNGRLFTSALTTGISCLPSCRPANRSPKTSASSPAAQPLASPVRARARNATPTTSPVAPIPCSQPSSHSSAKSALILPCSPTPAAVAAREPSDLLPLPFWRQKADDLIETARLITTGPLNLEALRTLSATRAKRTLRALRGLGPYTVNDLIMRALGFSDWVPSGDTDVTNGLRSAAEPRSTPHLDATRRLMPMFSPYRSLATAHLWQFNRPTPP